MDRVLEECDPSVLSYAEINKSLIWRLFGCTGAAIAFARDVILRCQLVWFDSESKHTIIDFMEDQSNDIKIGVYVYLYILVL